MLKTLKRKIKSITAELIACTLIGIATFIIGLIVIEIGSLIVVKAHLTYEQFRQAMIVICAISSVIAVIKILKEPEGG